MFYMGINSLASKPGFLLLLSGDTVSHCLLIWSSLVLHYAQSCSFIDPVEMLAPFYVFFLFTSLVYHIHMSVHYFQCFLVSALLAISNLSYRKMFISTRNVSPLPICDKMSVGMSHERFLELRCKVPSLYVLINNLFIYFMNKQKQESSPRDITAVE